MSQTPIQSKKICIEKAGAYDVLKWKDFILEAPKDNEIQIEIVAFGVNYADCLVRWGVYESAKKFVGWPITPGFEFSGHIKVLGKNVKNFSVGDKVFGITRFGAYASSINVV
ncbi:MAG: alcohol dehydrogenase catalytic domain-containing protein, partial [Proteobacteria bacterium]|nr:alcohol dehydrogenase catalytic domain-containing protein [Pseudomonadota bacterium]